MATSKSKHVTLRQPIEVSNSMSRGSHEASHPNNQKSKSSQHEPKLVCNERELSSNIEGEIKNGFFELK